MSRIVRLADGNDTPADAAAIDDYAVLLTVLLADATSAEQTRHQMHRLAWLIVDHARAIHIRETRAKRCA